MRIGFASLYAWRPHVEHMHYLALLAQQAGHEVRFLACDGDLPSCYSRQLRPHNAAWWECLKCRAGASRSYSAQGVSGIGSLVPEPDIAVASRHTAWARSSASTLWRFETSAEFAGEQAQRTAAELAPAVARTHAAAVRWIERERLDGVYLFNGRMDTTRAVLEAARACGVPFVSTERSWFGDGIQLLPGEDCLGLRSVDRMVAQYSELPLTASQVARIARHVASRFLRVNTTEWRAYNQRAMRTPWPARGGGPRVLMLPSSRNEFDGHPDWATGWSHPTAALDALMAHLNLSAADCVLRCHPNWSERIGHASGERPERYYTDWAAARGVHIVSSSDPASTLGLIEEADAVVVNGSSAGLEAGVLGKQVIATGPSWYQAAGFAVRAYSAAELADVKLHVASNPAGRAADSDRIARRALRFGYCMVGRAPQFTSNVLSSSATEFSYRNGADADKVARLLSTQRLEAEDATFASSTRDEDAVLAQIGQRDWSALLASARPPSIDGGEPAAPLRRRWWAMPVGALRSRWPDGSR